MSGSLFLDWAMLAASLFNTMLVLWLGLTVLLNADNRHLGVWLMSGGLFAGAGFLISHSALVGQAVGGNGAGIDPAVLNIWWRAGWIPLILSPFAWYLAVLWYGGFWSGDVNTLARRHRGWLWLMTLGLVGLFGWMLAANPIPAYEELGPLSLRATVAVPPLPRPFILFPLWMVACILLSIDALAGPAPAVDHNRGQARQHAHPWLLGTAGALLVMGLVVTYVIMRVLLTTGNGTSFTLPMRTAATYDLVLLLLIAIAALSLGQAVISYEIFTGRMLPRRSLFYHWRIAILLAGGYVAGTAWGIVAHLRPISSLLLAMVPLALFHALYSWRSLREHEQFVVRLRPFLYSVAPPGTNASAGDQLASELLATLCRHVLNTEQAQLIPLGSVAPLAGSTLLYPPTSTAAPLRPPPNLEQGITFLDPQHFTPYRWALPVQSERGLIGALLFGAKEDGALYGQEEMEIAGATAERILQLLASEGMVRQLMALQRSRATEQRVMDLRTRRTLHDEILPALHLAVLQLSGTERDAEVQSALDTLADAHRQIAGLMTDTQPTPAVDPDPCEIGTVLEALVEAEFAHQFEVIHWRSEPGGDASALYVDALTGEIVLGAAREVMRNAALHGRGHSPRVPLHLDMKLRADPSEITLSIRDNGVGMDATAGTTGAGGSGSGLALHSTLLAMVGGYLTVESPGEGTSVRIVIPRDCDTQRK